MSVTSTDLSQCAFVLSTATIPGDESPNQAWPLVKETDTDYLVIAAFDFADKPRRRILPLWWPKSRCRIVQGDDPAAMHLTSLEHCNGEDARLVREWLKKHHGESATPDGIAAFLATIPPVVPGEWCDGQADIIAAVEEAAAKLREQAENTCRALAAEGAVSFRNFMWIQKAPVTEWFDTGETCYPTLGWRFDITDGDGATKLFGDWVTLPMPTEESTK